MYFLMKKDQADKYALLDFSENKDQLIRFLDNWLKVNSKKMTYKPVKILENKKYRYIIQTSKGEEYFIQAFNSIDFKDYM